MTYTKCANCGNSINPVSYWDEIIDGKKIKFCQKRCAKEHLRTNEKKD